jgi:hypothetical protein
MPEACVDSGSKVNSVKNIGSLTGQFPEHGVKGRNDALTKTLVTIMQTVY